MIRRPPRSTPLSLPDALPICRRSLRSSPASMPERWTSRTRRSRWWWQPVRSGCPRHRQGRRRHRMRSSRRRSEEHTSELQSRLHPVCRLLLEKKKNTAVLEDSRYDRPCNEGSYKADTVPPIRCCLSSYLSVLIGAWL